MFQSYAFLFLPFPFAGRLADQQLDVAHVIGSVRQYLHKPKLLEYLQSPLHRAYLMPGKGGYSLHGMGKAVIQQKYSITFQRHLILFEQEIGVQKAVLHTLQNDHNFAVIKILFQLEVIKSSVLCHLVAPLVQNGFFRLLYAF